MMQPLKHISSPDSASSDVQQTIAITNPNHLSKGKLPANRSAKRSAPSPSSTSPQDYSHLLQVKQEEGSCKDRVEDNAGLYGSPTDQSSFAGTSDFLGSCDSSTVDKSKVLKTEVDSDICSSDGESQEVSRRLCMVCGDLASGYHYGIASCEACKAFFKRTVQGNLKYKCHGKKNCEISKKCRKACQSCRYKKCIKMGMMITGVRHDRLRGGRQKYRRKPEEKDFAPAPSSKIAKYKRVEELIDLLRKIEPLPTPGTPSSQMPSLQNKDAIFRVITIGTTIADKALVNTVAWAKQIPGFKKLPLEDQMILLQENWMEVLLWRVCHRSLDDEAGDRAVITEGVYLTKEIAKLTDCEMYFERGLSLIQKMRDLSLDMSEFLLIKAIIFLNLESPKIKDKSALQRLQNTMFDALHHYTNRKSPGDARRAYRLLTSLPIIRQLSVESVEFIARGSAENNIPLEQLHREMVECKASGLNSRLGLASPSRATLQAAANFSPLSAKSLMSSPSDNEQLGSPPSNDETLPSTSDS